MRCKTNIRSIAVVLVTGILVVLAVSPVVAGEKSPYLWGTWLHRSYNEMQTAYMLCQYRGDLALPGATGTGICSANAPMDWPTPDGGIITISEQMRGSWKWVSGGNYKLRSMALVTKENAVIGTFEIDGTITKQGENKMVGKWELRIIDLEGNELMQLPPMKGDFTRIKVEQ